jgi:hypothetical protein
MEFDSDNTTGLRGRLLPATHEGSAAGVQKGPGVFSSCLFELSWFGCHGWYNESAQTDRHRLYRKDLYR